MVQSSQINSIYRARYHVLPRAIEVMHSWTPPLHLQVMDAIVKCRTAALGGHLDECDICGHQHLFYNSCSNRHWPICGALAKERWLAARKKDFFVHVNKISDLFKKKFLGYLKQAYQTGKLEFVGKTPLRAGADNRAFQKLIDARMCPKCKKGPESVGMTIELLPKMRAAPS